MMIRCDKCNGTNVTKTMLNPPEVRVPTMSEYSKAEMGCVPAVMSYHKYRLECPDCNHSIEYTR